LPIHVARASFFPQVISLCPIPNLLPIPTTAPHEPNFLIVYRISLFFVFDGGFFFACITIRQDIFFEDPFFSGTPLLH